MQQTCRVLLKRSRSCQPSSACYCTRTLIRACQPLSACYCTRTLIRACQPLSACYCTRTLILAIRIYNSAFLFGHGFFSFSLSRNSMVCGLRPMHVQSAPATWRAQGSCSRRPRSRARSCAARRASCLDTAQAKANREWPTALRAHRMSEYRLREPETRVTPMRTY
jgi:hypothetical protein